MPTIRPISDLQRNAATLTKEAMETKEPIYLTRNGSAAVVLIDAGEYDRQLAAHEQLWRDYVVASVKLGREQHEAGKGIPLDEVLRHLKDRWGDDAY